MSRRSSRFPQFITYQCVASLFLVLLEQLAFAITNDGYRGNVIPGDPGVAIVGAPGATKVNTLSGNMFLSRTDLRIPGRGLPIEVILSYNSLGGGTRTSFGSERHFNYDMSCQGLANGNVLVTWGDARATTFRSLGGGAYESPQGVLATLQQVPGNMLRLATKQQIAFFFDLPALGAKTFLKSIQDPNGNAVTLIYNPAGQLTTITDASGRSISLTYTGRFVTTVTDSNASPPRTLHYAYAKGSLTSFTDPLGNVTTYTYGSNNRLTQIVDPLGITNISYAPGTPVGIVNSINRSSLTGSVLSTRSFSYDATTETTTVTDTLNGAMMAATNYHYDSNDRLVQITDPLGHIQTRTYDKNRNLASITDAKGNTNKFSYDSKGNVLTATDPLGHTTSYTYDGVFNKVTSLTDPNGHTTRLVYDSNGNVSSLQDPLGNTTQYSYDSFGQLLSRQNARGFTTTFTYNSFGDTTRTSDPLGRSWTFTYDQVGNVVSRTDARNNSIVYSYDARDRLTKAVFPDQTQALFSYDPQDDVLGAVDPNTQQVFVYDAAGRLVKATDNRLSKTISYQYDGIGNRIQMTDPEGAVTTYSYNLASQLTAIARNGQQFTFVYDNGNRRTALTLPPGSFASYSYDAADHLLSLANQRSDDSVISSFTYQYDNASNRTQLRLSTGDRIVYSYDARNQLISEVRTAGTSNYNHQFTYDPVGNRIQLDADGLITSYAYDAADQLTQQQTGASITIYSYDGNGNRVQKSTPVGLLTYSYDFRNRFAGFASPTTSASYAYDAFGRRITKSVGGATTQFFHDGLDAVAEYDGSGVLQAQNLFELGIDQNLARFGSAGTFYYLHDGLNSVRNILDGSQAVQNSYDYDAWGTILASVENVSNDYTFTGRQADRESFLYYFRARMYDSLGGRFTQTDPIDDNSGRSLNIYTDDNPVDFVDPLGTHARKSLGGADPPGILKTLRLIRKALWNRIKNPHSPSFPSQDALTAVKG